MEEKNRKAAQIVDSSSHTYLSSIVCGYTICMGTKMKRVIVLLLTMVLSVGVLAGCGGKSDTGNAGDSASKTTQGESEESEVLEVLRVAVIPVISSLPIQYIVDQGWDVENGFKIEKVVFSSGAPMGEALVSDLWDIGIMSAAGVFTTANYNGICAGISGISSRAG